ncbi:histidine kinase [Dyella jejuensis]|uniref:Histidine kinase n=1 Tax=Dyella jejuensis TaxID=1432009 RepID=A0ABW8JDM2_9GAMM
MKTYRNTGADPLAVPRSHGFWLAAWLGIVVLIGLLNALHRYLNDVADRVPVSLGPKLIEEMTGSLSFGMLLPVLIAALRRIRPLHNRWLRYGCHLLVLLALSLLHTSLMWGSRVALFRLCGLGGYDYGVMAWRYLMEFPSDVFYYLLVALVLWMFDRYRQGQQRELRAAQLESALSEAQLDALRLQLNPHFLFNTLNAVSAIMYDQPRVADEMLARIGELLRATLGARAQQHPLREEWRLLELYLDIQRARFGAQLSVRIQAEPSLGDATVPFLVLQPLVENAIDHADAAEIRRVDVSAAREHGRLELCVRNHGQGGGTHRGHGIGLSNIEARLKHLYGDAAGLRLEPGEQDTRVWLWLPLQQGSPA